MELICPSCEARYQLPDGAIGEKGRQVSCMSCGHGWHAYPPLVLGKSERSGGASSDRGIPFGAASGGRPVVQPNNLAHLREAQSDVDAPDTAPDLPNASRTEQLAEIREMLAEVQAEESAATKADPGSSAGTAASPLHQGVAPRDQRPPEPARGPGPADVAVAAASARSAGGEDEVDALRARLQQQSEKPAKAKEVDVKAIRRKHDRRERARKREKAAGSGAFLTGFMLVVMIVAVMIGLYVLHPAIIAKLPGTEPALTEYVATIDGLRVSVAETFDKARSWVTERSDKG